jgi:hypothetical protein
MRKVLAAVSVLLLGNLLVAVTPMPLSSKASVTAWEPAPAFESAQTSAVDGIHAAPPVQLPTTGTTNFLPIVVRNYQPPVTCSPDSPFGVQIAALHQIQSSMEQASVDPQSEAAWLAQYEEAFPSLVLAMQSSGACWVRFRIDWSILQPNPPPAAYVWGPYHDDKLRMIGQTGLQPIGQIDSVPTWAGPTPYGPIYPDHLGDFIQFLTDMVNRYKQPPYNIHTWELFNEADGNTGWGRNGDQYATMLSQAYPAIKAADPQATVLMGGLAYDWFVEEAPDGVFYRYFADDVMDAGGSAYLDALNLHYYRDFRLEWERWVPEGNPPTCGIVDDGIGTPYAAWGIDIIAKMNHFRNRMSVCHGVDKPLWITEFGEHGEADKPESLAQQSRYVFQGYARALAAGAKVAVWYALVSPPYDPYEQGLLYGDDFSPKPAYYTYQVLTAELEGYHYASTLNSTEVEGYVFGKPDSSDKTIAWSSDPNASPVTTFATTGQLRIVDRQGNVTFVKDGGTGDLDGSRNGFVRLGMTAEPVIVSR